jgi:hypothetical protein
VFKYQFGKPAGPFALIRMQIGILQEDESGERF